MVDSLSLVPPRSVSLTLFNSVFRGVADSLIRPGAIPPLLDRIPGRSVHLDADSDLAEAFLFLRRHRWAGPSIELPPLAFHFASRLKEVLASDPPAALDSLHSISVALYHADMDLQAILARAALALDPPSGTDYIALASSSSNTELLSAMLYYLAIVQERCDRISAAADLYLKANQLAVLARQGHGIVTMESAPNPYPVSDVGQYTGWACAHADAFNFHARFRLDAGISPERGPHHPALNPPGDPLLSTFADHLIRLALKAGDTHAAEEVALRSIQTEKAG